MGNGDGEEKLRKGEFGGWVVGDIDCLDYEIEEL